VKHAPKVLGRASISKWADGARAEQQPSWSGSGGDSYEMVGTNIYKHVYTETTSEFKGGAS